MIGWLVGLAVIEAETPKWMGAIEHFDPAWAPGAGAALSPKTCSRSALPRRSRRRASRAEQSVAHAIFALIGTLGVAAPVAIYFALGDRSVPILDRLKAWMACNNALTMAVLCIVIGREARRRCDRGLLQLASCV